MAKRGKKAGNESAERPGKKTPFPEKSNVAIIGGGIAGITAAIKLYRQGYKVTLFEQSDRLGGNMSSDSMDDKGHPQDVYPHIFADWYHEFWYLLEHDLEIPRSELFATSKHIHLARLPKRDDPAVKAFKDVKYATLATPTNIENVIDNLQSGAVSGRDMLLYGYSFLDLVSIPSETRRSKLLEELDVNGHLYSRPYMNNAVADLHDDTLKVIWSVPSEQTSAVAYQKMLRHSMTFPKGAPFAWFLTGPLQDKLMKPIEDRLGVALGERLKMACHVTRLDLDPDDTFAIVHWEDEGGVARNERYDYVVMATPAHVAADLVIGSSLAMRHPLLARLREAQAARIPVVHLYFNEDFWKAHREDFENVPKELIGFRRRGRSSEDFSRGSTSGNYDISMLNISEVWDETALQRLNPHALFPKEPVLLLAASQAEAIAAPAPSSANPDGGKAQAMEMIRRLKEYYPFIKIGEPSDDHSHIDWGRTRIVSNSEHLLFLNTVSSSQWRPNASLRFYKRASDKTYCRNVIFAGDYCMTPVDMATVEAATQSGVLAARALMNEVDEGEKAQPVQPHPLYTSEALVLAKLLSTPAAFAAALTAIYDEAATNPRRAATLPASAAIAAASYWADWMRSAEHLARLQMPGYRRARYKEWDRRDVDPADETLGVLRMAANAALALAVEGPRVAPALRESVVEAMYQGWRRAIGRVYFPDLPDTMRSDSDRRREFEARVEDQSARAVRDDAGGTEDAYVPSTWSDLFGAKLDGGTVAAAVGSTAFGVAAAGARLMRSFSRGGADDPQSASSASASDPLQALLGKALEVSELGEQLKGAVGHGLAASERRASGYRYYSPPRAFPKADPRP